jgi:hypothetical protein
VEPQRTWVAEHSLERQADEIDWIHRRDLFASPGRAAERRRADLRRSVRSHAFPWRHQVITPVDDR